MYTYICSDCGAISYSSTKEVNVPCPVCKSTRSYLVNSDKDNILKALSNFQRVLIELILEVEIANLEQIIATNYPFSKSLEEVLLDVEEWKYAIKNKLK